MESVIIGEILKPQGIKGELKVFPLTDNMDRYNLLKDVVLTDGKITKTFQVNKVRIDPKGMVYLNLEGIVTKEDAEKLRGFEIRIDRSEVPVLQDRWYYFELEGMKVYENEVLLGTLTRVLETGANDIYLVQGDKGEICVPALKSVVKKVDVPSKRMDVILPLGLLDD